MLFIHVCRDCVSLTHYFVSRGRYTMKALHVSGRFLVFKVKPTLFALAITAIGLSFTAPGAQGSTRAKAPSRGLASLKPLGQGEQMLFSEKNSAPRFLAPHVASRPVKFAGVCRDWTGQASSSASEQAYARCIDAQASNTGSVNQFFGGAQRQTGFGIRVGN